MLTLSKFRFDFVSCSFLVWAVNETDATGGLYIVDLADLTDQPLSATEGKIGLDGQIRQIVQNVAISAFKADPINSRVFIMVNDLPTNNRTIQAVPYSGYAIPYYQIRYFRH